MLVAIIKGPTFLEAQKEVQEALGFADLLEMRLDCFSPFSLATLANFQASLSLPAIFTLRKKSQGGKCNQERLERKRKIYDLIQLAPDYFDIEAEEGEEFFFALHQQFSHVKLIASHHDFEQMPLSLFSLVSKMPQKGVYCHKIAAKARSSLEALRMLDFLKNTQNRVSGIALGQEGQFARILAPIFQSAMTYAPSIAIPEEGQLSLKELVEHYHLRNLNRNTSIYALLGGSVEHMQSYRFHNEYFFSKKKNAVYVKFNIREEEFALFLSMAKALSFKGMSVTMPWKEKILPFLDEVTCEAKRIGAINTLYLHSDRWMGENVDGKGALDAIEEKRKVAKQRLFLLGSGGFARAIVHEALKRGAEVHLVARNEEKRKEFSSYFQIPSHPLEGIDQLLQSDGYDILMNATPNGMDPEKEQLLIHTFFPEALIVEGIHNRTTLFLKAAKEKGCEVVCGQEIFRKQALLQQTLWN